MNRNVSRDRRAVLGFLVAAAGIAVGGSAAGQVCVDPTKISSGQRASRKGLNYREPSADPKRACAGCAFFTGTAAGCGTCLMLGGGPVSAKAVCDSWTVKK